MMRFAPSHKLWLFLLSALVWLPVQAQDFNWEAPVKPVYSTGYYKIFITPMVSSKLTHNFSDLRLYDAQKKEVPYLLINARDVERDNKRHYLKIIDSKHKKRKAFTRIVIDNEEKHKITNLGLLINNDINEAWLKISGSNDLKKWGIIQDDAPYLTYPSGKEGRNEIRIDNIPVSHYRYYEIRLFDKAQKAIELERAFYYDMEISHIEYIQLPTPKIEQAEKPGAKQSIVNIQFNDNHYIDKLAFDIEGPEYYLRTARIINDIPLAEKKFNLEYFQQINRGFSLTSEHENVLHLSNYQVKDLELVIENKDSRPLKIKSVKAYQIKKYLVAHLQESMQYFLQYGNKQVRPPVYDLKYFKDSITGDLPMANIKHTIAISQSKTNKPPLFNIPPLFLWIGVGVLLLALILMAMRILREIDKNEA